MSISPRNKSRQTGKRTFDFSYAGYTSPLNDHTVYDNNEELKGSVTFGGPKTKEGKLIRLPTSCRHTKYTVSQRWSTVFADGGFFTPVTFPHNSLYGPSVFVESYLQDQIDSELYSLVNKLEKRFRPLDEGFNAFNFFYELREVASLLDPAKAVLSRLTTPAPKSKRGRKWVASVADDLTGTYVNANFGYVPTISDGFQIFERLGSLESSFDDLKKALKPRRSRLKSQFPFSFKTTSRGENESAGVIYDITFRGTVKLSCGGRCEYKMDMLESLGPLLASVQRGGISKINLATFWNAVPFSWAVDWLVPIGDALDSLSGDPIGISRSVSGTYSYHIEGTWFVKKEDIRLDHPVLRTPWPNYPIDDSFGKISIYNRNVLPESLVEYRHPPIKLPKLDLRKLLIGASIGFGFRK